MSETSGWSEKLILQAILYGEREVIRGMRRMHQQANEQTKAMNRMADTAEAAERRRAAAAKAAAARQEKLHKSLMYNMRQMRWQIITLMFFFREFGEIVQAVFEQIAESAENAATRGGVKALAAGYQTSLQEIHDALQGVADGTLSTMEAVTLAQAGLTADLGQFADLYDEYWQAARVVQVSAGVEAEDVFSGIAESMAKADAEILDNVTTLFQARGAVKEYADALGVGVDELEDWQKQEAIFSRVQEVTNTLLANGADEALMAGKGFDQLKATFEELKDVLGALVEGSQGVQVFNQLLITLTQLLIMASAAMKGLAAEGINLQDIFAPGNLAFKSTFNFIAGLGKPEEQSAAFMEAYEKEFARLAEAVGLFQERVGEALPTPLFDEDEETDKARQRSIEAILRHIEKREDLIRKHQDRLAKMWSDYQDRIADIERKADRDIERTRREAQRDRAKAWRKYNRDLYEEFRDYHRREQQELEKHQQDIQHDRERFRAESVQNERLYQYERSLLVAEGDVLAIEDLDARFELEKQARQENQQIQERQMEETFQLEKEQRREDFEAELEDMRYQHRERLREIDIQERERIAEINERRREALDEAKADYEAQRQAEIENQRQRLDEWARFWDNIARQTEVGTDKITEIIRAVYGPSGEATQILQSFQEDAERTLALITMIEDILGETTSTSGAHRGRPYAHSRRGGIIGGRQFGGDEWFSRPTLLMVGEGQTPERVTTQPMYGGNVSLSWRGGPIPLQGSGGLEGADLSGVGDAIARGLMTTFRRELIG